MTTARYSGWGDPMDDGDPAARAAAHDLGPYADLVSAARKAGRVGWARASAKITRDDALAALATPIADTGPIDLRRGRTWKVGDIVGEEVSWSAGYGPRTEALLYRPERAVGPSAAVLALHDHGLFKYYGKEKLADGPDGVAAGMAAYRSEYYGGRPYALDLARAGFVVLVHDAFSWGSRRFPQEVMTGEARIASPLDMEAYNQAAISYEHVIEKYCRLLGTSYAALIAHDDRIALGALRSLAEVDEQRIGCIGLSGGGGRAAMLRAGSKSVRATVIVGMMSTYEHLLSKHVRPHSWLFFPDKLPAACDWPDLVGCAAPEPLLVQYDCEDELFTSEGMRAADAKLRAVYEEIGSPENYCGRFYPGPHKFDRAMQGDAFLWLARQLQH
jgi:dienelactone hydrolase